eukprot:UN05472
MYPLYPVDVSPQEIIDNPFYPIPLTAAHYATELKPSERPSFIPFPSPFIEPTFPPIGSSFVDTLLPTMTTFPSRRFMLGNTDLTQRVCQRVWLDATPDFLPTPRPNEVVLTQFM